MLLENNYYKINSVDKREECLNAIFHLSILPDCVVYDGHFPGNPVCPGVCNIEMIRECAALLCGHDLRIRTIKQCRLVSVASPLICPEVDITINVSILDKNRFMVVANISDAERTYLDYKGEMGV